MSENKRRESKLSDLPIRQFLDRVASKAPVPGGGSVSALHGAVAASLVEMVANLTLGRRGFEAVEAFMAEAMDSARACRQQMMESIDTDAEAYAAVMAAFRLPTGTQEEKAARTRTLQQAFAAAARVPLGVAEHALELMGLAVETTRKGNPNAASDGAVAVLTAKAAALGAVCNVRINLSSIRDKAMAADLAGRAAAVEDSVAEKEQRFLDGLAL